jgi:hypothetical protein
MTTVGSQGLHHDVVGLEARAEKLLDDGLHRRSRLDEEEDLSGVLSAATKSGAAAPSSPPGILPCPATNFSTTAVVRL